MKIIAASVCTVSLACASTRAARSVGTIESTHDLAMTVASATGEESYKAMMGVLTQGIIANVEKMMLKEGSKVPSNLRQVAAEILGQALPYDIVVAINARFYERHFTREELQEISAFQRSAVFNKQVTLMPALMQYASQELQTTLASLGPELEAKLKSRLTTTP